MIFLIGWLLHLSILTNITVIVKGVIHYNITKKEWNTQFATGKWDYLGKAAVEKARNSVISGVFALAHFPKGSVLDVGCGEGSLISLFLSFNVMLVL
jgi:2-polyprenyl-3-methyl-5-hydroxy-6-metoxy-1,4-benzoquinol methylase